MNTLPSPLPTFPRVTVATLHAEGLLCALDALNDNLAGIASMTARLQEPEAVALESFDYTLVERIATYTKQAQHWANLIRKLHAEGAR